MSTLLRYLRSRGALSLSCLALIAAAAGSGTPVTGHIRQYLMASEAREIRLARSAAPPSLSGHATIMVLTSHGYAAAAKGDNGFVCLVARSWDNSVAARRARFWDPRFRAPYCFNRAGARSVLARYLMRTRWVLAGASKSAIGARQQAARKAGRIPAPAPGAMSYMMSKEGRGVGGQPGAWRPHVMFYFPRAATPNWGANLQGNPVYGNAHADTAVFYVLVPVWSDGSPAPAYR